MKPEKIDDYYWDIISRTKKYSEMIQQFRETITDILHSTGNLDKIQDLIDIFDSKLKKNNKVILDKITSMITIMKLIAELVEGKKIQIMKKVVEEETLHFLILEQIQNLNYLLKEAKVQINSKNPQILEKDIY